MSNHHQNKRKFGTNKNNSNRGNFPIPNRAGNDINYHVLRCRPVITKSSPQNQHDHLQVLVEIESGTRFWMTINSRSGNQSDKVLFNVNTNYENPIVQKLASAQLPDGFTALEKKPDGLALDYQKMNLVDMNSFQLVTEGVDSETSDIEQMLTTEIINASRHPDAKMYVFGSMFTDGERFSSYHLATGIHDIHMNQGSQPPHTQSNGTYQDGALFIHYRAENIWTAIFMKFESQNNNTDANGN
ncbi:MAG: hypothetical protein C0459_08410 [Chitinophaga sp.]|jgi:uncharacterized protein YukJ|nr:hypothetical protein [Chitinophaga sp.]